MTRETRGFTLIELMIVVAILGILAAIAVPFYTGYIEDSRASEATSNLETLRVIEEQELQDKGEYTAGADTVTLAGKLPAFKVGDAATIAKMSYEYSVTVAGKTFIAKAVRKTNAAKYFTIDEKGVKLRYPGGVAW